MRACIFEICKKDIMQEVVMSYKSPKTLVEISEAIWRGSPVIALSYCRYRPKKWRVVQECAAPRTIITADGFFPFTGSYSFPNSARTDEIRIYDNLREADEVLKSEIN